MMLLLMLMLMLMLMLILLLLILLSVFFYCLLLFSVTLSVGRFPTSYVRPSLAVMRCLVDSNRPEELEQASQCSTAPSVQHKSACNQCEIETMSGNTLTVHMNHKWRPMVAPKWRMRASLHYCTKKTFKLKHRHKRC